MTRHALYFTPPPGSALAEFGRRWFEDPQAAPLTESARRYGFHATLKAPFHLAAGCSEGDLRRALAAFCAGRPAVTVERPVVASLDGFLAVVPAGRQGQIGALAEACVRHFDGFRAPAGAEELSRRRAAGLTARQEAHLQAWGYPYVLDEFRFHMTLTRRLDAAEQERLRPRLAASLAESVGGAFAVDALSLSVQPAADAPFEVRERVPLSG